MRELHAKIGALAVAGDVAKTRALERDVIAQGSPRRSVVARGKARLRRRSTADHRSAGERAGSLALMVAIALQVMETPTACAG